VDSTNLFIVPKPNTYTGIGFDILPENILTSKILSGNDLAQLANIHELPFIDPAFDDEKLKNIIQYYSINPDDMENEIHIYASQLLKEGRLKDAWQVLLSTTN
jgi:hypothetical protein